MTKYCLKKLINFDPVRLSLLHRDNSEPVWASNSAFLSTEYHPVLYGLYITVNITFSLIDVICPSFVS